MKKSRFADSQIMAILKQHEACVPVAQYGPDLSVAFEIWRHGCIDDEGPEGAGS